MSRPVPRPFAHPAERNILLHGSSSPLPEAIPLAAGNVVLELEDRDARYIRSGPLELVRRVYASVRDVNWNEVPAAIGGFSMENRGDGFSVTFESRHRAAEFDFEWRGAITGSNDGTIVYEMEGRVRRSLRYTRIGLCVLLPISTTAGRPYRATTPERRLDGVLPTLVAPQPYVDGVFLPLFPSFSALEVELATGQILKCEFEGDLFEIEDQRNWTDGSFKTYCTPAALGFPHYATAGQTFMQRVTFRVAPGLTIEPPTATHPSIEVGEAVGPMPRIGLGVSSQLDRLGPREVDLIRGLRPGHLRVDLVLADATWRHVLERAMSDAAAARVALEVAVFVSDAAEAELTALGRQIATATVSRYLVFHEDEANDASTAPGWVALARRILGPASPGAAFVGGTTGNFAEVNRDRPHPGTYDALCFPMNPQVHASDIRSMVETIEGQADAVRTARSFFGGRIVVSAVTLKPPLNRTAAKEANVRPGALPPDVDPRQISLFGASWTTASLAALATAGASSVTYFETAGWRGLFETAAGNPLPELFPASPGTIFPVYAVFEALADAGDATVLACRSSEPLLAAGLALRIGGRIRLLVANLAPVPRRFDLRGLAFDRAVLRRPLQQWTGAAEAAAGEPRTRVAVEAGLLAVELRPFDVIRIDEEPSIA